MFTRFEERHRKALDDIQKYIDNTPKDFSDFIKWLLKTHIKACNFLPDGWGRSLDSAGDFLGLVSVLNHSLYDDGDLTFIKVNGKPRIDLHWHKDDKFEELALTSYEIHCRDHFGVSFRVEILNVTIPEFIKEVEEYEKLALKKHFIQTAKVHGIKQAIANYKDDQSYSEEWVKDFYNK